VVWRRILKYYSNAGDKLSLLLSIADLLRHYKFCHVVSYRQSLHRIHAENLVKVV